MENNKKLARKRFKLKDENGNYMGSISAISIVSSPATEKKFELFGEAPKKINFQVSNKEKMEITGVIMAANKDILRFDDESNEYYLCYFTAEDIVDYRDFFMSKADTRQSNLEHGYKFFEDFFLTESWICVDKNNDKSNAIGLKDVENGDWVGTFKCTSEEMWNVIKEGDFSGFSVEISLAHFNEVELEKKLESIVDNPNLSREEKKEQIRAIIYK